MRVQTGMQERQEVPDAVPSGRGCTSGWRGPSCLAPAPRPPGCRGGCRWHCPALSGAKETDMPLKTPGIQRRGRSRPATNLGG